MSRWAVVLAGGVGSRFWPLSTPNLPKQLLHLVEDRPLLEATLARLEPIASRDRTLVLTNAGLVQATLDRVRRLRPENLIAEPKPAGTAAALAWAAQEVLHRDDANATMICVHADWAIGDEEGFRSTLVAAAEVAEAHDALVTVGIVPTRPDTGFGYIEPGRAVAEAGDARHVARFVEKPKRERARKLVEAGCLWNSGIFVWKAARFLAEIREHTPEVSVALDRAESAEEFFASVEPISVDEGVLERSSRVMVVPGSFGWDDVGTWAALNRVLPLDSSGNAVRGRASLVDSSNNVVFAEDSRVVLYGVNDLVVVSCRGITLVTTRELAADLKVLLSELPADLKGA